MAGRSKLTPEQREAVLARIAGGASYEEAAGWCLTTYSVQITKQAIGLLVNKHRGERADVSKAIARDHIARRLPADLVVADEMLEMAVHALRLAYEALLQEDSSANYEKFSKATGAYAVHKKMHNDTLGLNQPDNAVVIENVADLCGLALDFEEKAAEEAAFAEPAEPDATEPDQP